MKLHNELPEIIRRFTEIQDDIKVYAEDLKAGKFGEYKNFETRLIWDCLYEAFNAHEIFVWGQKYNCNDSNIETAARAALKEIGIL